MLTVLIKSRILLRGVGPVQFLVGFVCRQGPPPQCVFAQADNRSSCAMTGTYLLQDRLMCDSDCIFSTVVASQYMTPAMPHTPMPRCTTTAIVFESHPQRAAKCKCAVLSMIAAGNAATTGSVPVALNAVSSVATGTLISAEHSGGIGSVALLARVLQNMQNTNAHRKQAHVLLPVNNIN